MSTTYDGNAREDATAKVAGARGVAEFASLQRARSGETQSRCKRGIRWGTSWLTLVHHVGIC